MLGGLALILAHAFARDSDGYYTTGTERLATSTYALTAEDIDLGTEAADVVPEDVLGRIRIRAERPGGRPVFVGIGPEREVDAYIRGVAHAEVEELDPPRYRTKRGGAPGGPPSDERFWVASTQGSGRQTVSWEVEGGQWTVVAMNADAARRVVIEADLGAKVGWFLGVVLIVVAARRASRPPAPRSAPSSTSR